MIKEGNKIEFKIGLIYKINSNLRFNVWIRLSIQWHIKCLIIRININHFDNKQLLDFIQRSPDVHNLD
jgi:hypothetical protein